MNTSKKILLLLAIVFCFSCNNTKNTKPSDYLTQTEIQQVLKSIIPYSAKLPKGYDYKNRFDSKLDSFYTQEMNKYHLEKYYVSEKDSFHYFLLSRSAPSIYEKRITIAGKFKKHTDRSITDYEEAFWTFKMKSEELEKKSTVLFDDYIEGKNLTKYQPENMEDWIEFPDKNVKYDKIEQRWKSTINQ